MRRKRAPERPRIIVVTGTDTGVGKTVLTALLLAHLRRTGIHALAMKPFCSGGRGDVELLQRIQDQEVADRQMNPFYFRQPVAPLVAARAAGRRITARETVKRITALAERCQVLLVEGAGGLLTPLGEGFCLRDLIEKGGWEVIVVARNQLGTINHTLLTLAALRSVRFTKVVLMNTGESDRSSKSNPAIICEQIAPWSVFVLPRIGTGKIGFRTILRAGKRLNGQLGCIVGRGEG